MGVHLLALFVFLLINAHCSIGQFTISFNYKIGSEFVEIDEEEPIGSIIVDLEAEYYDKFNIPRSEGIGVYSLVPAQDYALFNITSDTGQLTNAVIFDRESLNSTILAVTVNYTVTTDGLVWDTVDLTINILDINDNTPIFSQPVYNATILEDSLGGAFVYQVTATDADQVIQQQILDENNEDFGAIVYIISNGRVIYTIIDGNVLNHFSIHQDDGTVSVAPMASLDVDYYSFYNLTILATDGGGLNSTASLLITVADANDNAPVIHYPSTDIYLTYSEDISPNITIIDYINATDDDTGANADIEFIIQSGDVTNSFTINSTSGHLLLSDYLDRESGDPLVLTIAAVDHGFPTPLSDTITVTIDLLDINDSPPRFTEDVYTFHINENVVVGHSVDAVQAIDLDAGENGTVIYTLLTNSSVFSLDNTTGMVYTTNVLDRETVPMYVLVVQATDTPTNDSLTFTSTATVHVIIDDANDNSPQWEQPEGYSVGILDTEAVGYGLITLQATDADNGTNAEISYQFINAADDDFIIETTTGKVVVNRDLDFHVKPQYVYTVRAFDGGSPSRSSNLIKLNITIHTTNTKTPKFKIKEYNATIDETTSIGTALFNVTARDNDPGLIGELHYRIPTEWQFNAAGSFDVNADTGTIFVNGTLDYDYRLVVYH